MPGPNNIPLDPPLTEHERGVCAVLRKHVDMLAGVIGIRHDSRPSSIEAAVDAHPDIDAIPGRNVRHLQQIGTATLARRLQACFRDSDESIL